MDILKLGLIFLMIIIATKKNKPLYIAMSFGIEQLLFYTRSL